MVKKSLLALVVVAALAGCGSDDDVGDPADEVAATSASQTGDATEPGADPAPSPGPTVDGPSADPQTAPPGGATLIGTLTGDAGLEGGCAWIEPTGGVDGKLDRVEPMLPDGYRIEFDPGLVLIGPDGEVVASDGDEVSVVGAVAADAASLCQTGVIYQVEEVVAVGSG
jgi:hypothetical protein